MNERQDETARRFPMSYPCGWFHVAFSDELSRGAVLPLRYFGRDLVLFRTENGRAHVLDAFCLHLGAHLGHGGVVRGESIVCPFHSWSYDGIGECVNVPYLRGKPNPPRGRPRMRAWPTVERNRSIFVWYHPLAHPPTFELVDVPELLEGQWPEQLRCTWTVRTHIQEAQENYVDVAHFRSVHDSNPRVEMDLSGHRCQVSMDFGGKVAPAYQVTTLNGPGQSWSRFGGPMDALILNPITPIDDDHIALSFAIGFREDLPPSLFEARDSIVANLPCQVEQDIRIFENKIYRASPLLCSSDGPIAEFRDWFGQFYVDDSGREGTGWRLP